MVHLGGVGFRGHPAHGPDFAYRLICRNSVEEKIAELQGQKRSLADAILQSDVNLMKDLTVADLEKLLS